MLLMDIHWFPVFRSALDIVGLRVCPLRLSSLERISNSARLKGKVTYENIRKLPETTLRNIECVRRMDIDVLSPSIVAL
jgi:hypothetical protein